MSDHPRSARAPRRCRAVLTPAAVAAGAASLFVLPAAGQVLVNEDFRDGSFNVNTFTLGPNAAAAGVGFRPTNNRDLNGDGVRNDTAFSRIVNDAAGTAIGGSFDGTAFVQLANPVPVSANDVILVRYSQFSDLATNSAEYYGSSVEVGNYSETRQLLTNGTITTSPGFIQRVAAVSKYDSGTTSQSRDLYGQAANVDQTTGVEVSGNNTGTDVARNSHFPGGVNVPSELDAPDANGNPSDYTGTSVFRARQAGSAAGTEVEQVGENVAGQSVLVQGSTEIPFVSSVNRVTVTLQRQFRANAAHVFATAVAGVNNDTNANPNFTNPIAQVGVTQLFVAKYNVADVDRDGQVAASDFQTLNANFNKADATWADGDADNDGAVNAADFQTLNANFGAGSGGQNLTAARSATAEVRKLSAAADAPAPLALDAGNNGVADLTYDPASGMVRVDASFTMMRSFVLRPATGGTAFESADYAGGPPDSNAATPPTVLNQFGEVGTDLLVVQTVTGTLISESLGSPSVPAVDGNGSPFVLGGILPAGLTDAQFRAFFSQANYNAVLGGGTVNFDLVYAVPEPGTAGLALAAAAGLLARRRRAGRPAAWQT